MDDTLEPTQVLLAGRRTLLVRIVAKSGMRPAVLELLNTYTDGLGEEPGTEMFVVSLDPENEDTVWLYEMFRDEDAMEEHRASNGFHALMASLPNYLESPPAVLRMDPLRMAVHDKVLEEDLTF